MEYIFFDIECANCFHGHGKICSFGYVITDESFNVIEKNDILMNPHSRFCLTGHKNHPGIVLGYDEKAFNSSPDFKHYYNTIRNLLTRPNSIKFGFAVLSDAGFLKSECERFSKELFDFDFIDIQRIYTDFNELDNTPGLIKCAHEYGISDNQDVHKSDDDSFYTMIVLKGLCKETGLDPQALIERFPHCKCRCINGEIESEYLKYREIMKSQKLSKMEKLTGSVRSNWIHTTEKNALDFSNYYKRVYVDKAASSYFQGKRVCISSLYEEYHFNEMMNIVSCLAKNGAKYTRHAFSCNIFVTYNLLDKNGEPYRCYRKDKVDIALSEGKNIEILDISDLLRILDISNEEIQVLDRKNLAPIKKRKFIKSI
ncbi:MAG: hypothetical protein IJW54_03790 [Clostridia bacterium]|nr:hypothetical protein [Clostridia bacterium]